MSDIFISYSSEDRERARTLAHALEERGWSVWWDREIPLGRSYDEVIEQALNGARCMLVLWTAASAASEWVRSEASEGKRRGILVPVFLDEVEAPLAFRLLNGAQLWNWKPDEPNAEFDRLTRRVAEILAQAPAGTGERPTTPLRPEATEVHGGHVPLAMRRQWKPPWVVGGGVVMAVLLLIAGYLLFRPAPPPPQVSSAVPVPGPPGPANPANPAVPGPAATGPGNEFPGLEEALRPLAQSLGNPGSLALQAFKIPALALDITFVGREQSQATGGTLPTGAVVWAVSDGAAQQAGVQVFDVVTAIDGHAVRDDNDLRRLIGEMGPGKHTLRILRKGADQILELNCPACEPSHKGTLATKPKQQPPTKLTAVQPTALPKPAPKSTLKPETVIPPVKVTVAPQRSTIVLAARGLPISRSFWSGESSATYSRKMEGLLQRASRDILHVAPKAIDLPQAEFNAWWNESRDHARSNARCAEGDAPKALLSAKMETPPAFSSIESAYWPELQLRLWVCSKQMGYRQVKVLSPNRDDEWPFSVELGAETERFLREHRADISDQE
jgi:membrane-associated protease RseP (regulator of RpoE activity)